VITNRDQALKIAQDSSATSEVLEQIVREYSGEADILRAVIRHPNAPPELIFGYPQWHPKYIDTTFTKRVCSSVRYHPEDLFNNPSAILHFIADPRLLCDAWIVRHLVQHVDCPLWMLEFISKSAILYNYQTDAILHVNYDNTPEENWAEEVKKLLLENISRFYTKQNVYDEFLKIQNLTVNLDIDIDTDFDYIEKSFNQHYPCYCGFISLNCLPRWLKNSREKPIKKNKQNEKEQTVVEKLQDIQNYFIEQRGVALRGRDSFLHFVAYTHPTTPKTRPDAPETLDILRPEVRPQPGVWAWIYRLETVLLPETTQEELLKLKNDANRYVRAAARDRLAGKDVLGYFWGEGQ
jgi:hypothetical protein